MKYSRSRSACQQVLTLSAIVAVAGPTFTPSSIVGQGAATHANLAVAADQSTLRMFDHQRAVESDCDQSSSHIQPELSDAVHIRDMDVDSRNGRSGRVPAKAAMTGTAHAVHGNSANHMVGVEKICKGSRSDGTSQKQTRTDDTRKAKIVRLHADAPVKLIPTSRTGPCLE